MWYLRKIFRFVSERIFYFISFIFEVDVKMVLNRACGIECRKEFLVFSFFELEYFFVYEIVFENGIRILIIVKV